ncbi:copper amine oxidase [Dactylonectria macrodidyma]|uniref:Amine oxidase n=1 Tax=Dactylonectria macrodidyma TaxID=307937 RepID=A0A9P9ENX9_9HYPO|nr:copper amine oxidase [Dactylonectria macrodidyma]
MAHLVATTPQGPRCRKEYKGQRILYELGLQKALDNYAGSDPIHSRTAYPDTCYGFGPFAFGFLNVHGCPAICLFEFDANHLMDRHSTSEYVAATKNVYFTVRSVSTIGNYDYMFSCSFFMDGSITVEARASGYIRAAFFAKNHHYPFQIHDQLSGLLHDHMPNYKADFDILGTENTVQSMGKVPHNTTYPPLRGKVLNTIKWNRSYIENEDEGAKWAEHDIMGDLPTTVFTTAHPRIQFVPTNYLDIGASVEMANMVRTKYQGGVTMDVINFGAYDGTCDLDYEPAVVGLWEHKGDAVVRKFPCSPDDPYYQTGSISQVNRTTKIDRTEQ